jgi:hypothetical protein
LFTLDFREEIGNTPTEERGSHQIHVTISKHRKPQYAVRYSLIKGR